METNIIKQKYIHIFEVCGRKEILTPEEAYAKGCDYPPLMGTFGVISPRTCGVCSITKTLYWTLVTKKVPISKLSDKQKNAFSDTI